MSNNKFGVTDFTSGQQPESSSTVPDLSARLSHFKPTPTRRIDTATMDAAAAPHGFTSREPTPLKRRRLAPREPRPNNMGIRLSDSEKARFVAFADQHRLNNYSDTIAMLLDIAEGKM